MKKKLSRIPKMKALMALKNMLRQLDIVKHIHDEYESQDEKFIHESINRVDCTVKALLGIYNCELNQDEK